MIGAPFPDCSVFVGTGMRMQKVNSYDWTNWFHKFKSSLVDEDHSRCTVASATHRHRHRHTLCKPQLRNTSRPGGMLYVTQDWNAPLSLCYAADEQICSCTAHACPEAKTTSSTKKYPKSPKTLKPKPLTPKPPKTLSRGDHAPPCEGT